MITINKELFIYVLFIWIFIASITQIISGIVNAGEEKRYSLWDTLNGIVLLIILFICLLL